MKKPSFFSIFVFSCMLIVLAGCESTKEIDFSFSAGDIESVEIFSGGVPAQAEKKIVTETEDIEDIIKALSKLSIERDATNDDRIAGGIGNIFRFQLSKGDSYALSVHQNLLRTTAGFYIVKNTGIGTAEFFTSLAYESVKVDESELPVIPAGVEDNG